ncbi:MAG: spore coat protein, partial [Planctomycetes bacterium]|nr:spore coat protein [Planctomycetota bacterium]
AELRDGRIVGIEEKPSKPKGNLAVIGIYMFDRQVFEIIRTLKPSGRGELEITDVNNAYLDQEIMTYDILDGWWTDAGTFESLDKAWRLVADGGANKIDQSTTLDPVAQPRTR